MSQRPVRSVHGATDTPPPHWPPAQVSPVVHALPPSHVAPSADGVHTDGSPLHEKHGSIWHCALQPSPSVESPSKHWQRVTKKRPTPKDCSISQPSRRVPKRCAVS